MTNISLVLRKTPKNLVQNFIRRSVHTTCPCSRFWEESPKGVWRDYAAYEAMLEETRRKNMQNWFGLRDGFKDVRMECKKWTQEWRTKITDEGVWNQFIDDKETFYKFNTVEDLKVWGTLADSDHNIGFSSCELTLSPTGHGLFHGYINAHLPKQGTITRAGFCGIKSERVTRSFGRDSYHNWENYTHLVMKVRGDGRSYMINLSTAGTWDLTWNDVYHFPLYTRGGPYWQYVKIPFTKFIFASKGRIQDRQEAIARDQIASVGLTVSKIEGPFNIEIDHIGVVFDPRDESIIKEEHAYEHYILPKGIADV